MSTGLALHLTEAAARVYALCGAERGTRTVLLCEAGSRIETVNALEAGLHRIGAHYLRLTMPSPAPTIGAVVRSTGASTALSGNASAIAALKAAEFIVDCTVEGLQHAPELSEILQAGARVLVIADQHPEILLRTEPLAGDEAHARAAMRDLRAANTMRVTSNAGTELTIQLKGARVGGVWGFSSKPASLTHWPGGLCLAFPAPRSVNGTLVLAKGDVNLTFKRYLSDSVRLTIVDDYVHHIEGDSVEAEFMRGYLASWQEPEAYAVSHVGFGLNQRARWDSLLFYDKVDFNGTELRAFAGNFLFSTGANEVAGRFTRGHFDLPLRACDVYLDHTQVIQAGVLQKYV